LDEVLRGLRRAAAECGPGAFPAGLGRLDERLAAAAGRDLAAVLSLVLSALGRAAPHGTPDGCRETGADTLFGHVGFTCAYYGPAPERMTRQARRARERAAEKGRRLRKNGGFPRAGGAEDAFPLKKALGLADGMTPALAGRLQRAAVAAGSFAEGAGLLALLSGVRMSESTFRRRALAAGRRALEAQENPAAWVPEPLLPAWLLAVTAPAAPTLYILLDGTGVPCVKKDMRGVKGKDGKKPKTREVKVGVVGTYRRLDKKGRPVRDPGCESHIVSPKNAAEFGSLLRRLALSRGFGSGRFRIQVIGDGAEWVVNIARTAFKGADVVFTCDFYHACEHLRDFLGLALPQKDVRKAFVTARAVLRRHGGASLLKHLRKRCGHLPPDHPAWDKLGYFEKRKDNMRYGEYRKQGLFIGSGVVEAACRTDVARRCKQSGMHWRFHNAAALCALAARFRSHLPAA
jgi:hypothetical protein